MAERQNYALQRTQFQNFFQPVVRDFMGMHRDEHGEFEFTSIVPLGLYETTLPNGTALRSMSFYMPHAFSEIGGRTTDWILTLSFDQTNSIVAFVSTQAREYPIKGNEQEEREAQSRQDQIPTIKSTGVISSIRGGERLGSVTETMHMQALRLYATSRNAVVMDVLNDANRAQLQQAEQAMRVAPQTPGAAENLDEAKEQRTRWESLFIPNGPGGFNQQGERFFSPTETTQIPQSYMLTSSGDLLSQDTQAMLQKFNGTGLNFSPQTIQTLIRQTYQQLLTP